MYRHVPTLTDFILQEGRKHTGSTGSFTILMSQIENVAKIIASHVKASGLVDILGKTGDTNTFGEEVQKLDEFANKLMVEALLSSGEVHAIVSEEVEKEMYASKGQAGKSIVYFDPL